MSSDADREETSSDQPTTSKPTGRRPAGYRVLHVFVPERTFNHVKAQAFLSGLRFPEYLAKFLEEARPYPVPELPSLGRQPPAA